MSDRRPSPPLALTDEHLRIVSEYAAPLLPSARSPFLQRVAQLLLGERDLARPRDETDEATSSSLYSAARRRLGRLRRARSSLALPVIGCSSPGLATAVPAACQRGLNEGG